MSHRWVTEGDHRMGYTRGNNALEKNSDQEQRCGICPISYAGQNMPVPSYADDAGISRKTAYKWLARSTGRASGIA